MTKETETVTIQTIKDAIDNGKKVTFKYQARQQSSSFTRTIRITDIESLGLDWFRVKANGMWQQVPIAELARVSVE